MIGSAASAGIEAWVLALEAELANPTYEGDDVSPEQWATLEGVLISLGVSVDWLVALRTHGRATTSGNLPDAVAELLGGAAGTFFGQMPTLRRLMAADRLISWKAGSEAFSLALAKEVGSDVGKRAALATCLKDLVHSFTWAPGRIIYAHHDNMCALAEHYYMQPRLDNVWSIGRSGILFVKYIPAFDSLRLLDQGLYLRLLDDFPHPEPGRHIIDYAAKLTDIDGLLNLLAAARPCFKSGDWLPWVKTPVLVLAEVEAKLDAMAGSAEVAVSATMDAFAAAVNKTVKVILERADGNELGHAWLQRLVQRRKLGNGNRLGNELSGSEYHGRLLFDLASALSPRCCVVDWVRAEQDAWRRDRAVAAIAAAGLGETGSHDTAAALIRNVLPLGLWTTAQADNFLASSSSERRLMGSVIGGHPEPAVCFDKLWRSLASLRDRARHVTTSGGGHPADATVIAVTWFLFGLDAVDVSTPAHRALWRCLFSAIRECTMVQACPLAQPQWHARYQFLAGHLAHRLITVGDTEAMLDLQTLLDPLLALDMILAEVIAVLFDAGVTPSVIAAGSGRPFRLVALLRRLETEQAWREAKQKEQLGRQSAFSQKVARIANAIEASLLSNV